MKCLSPKKPPTSRLIIMIIIVIMPIVTRLLTLIQPSSSKHHIKATKPTSSPALRFPLTEFFPAAPPVLPLTRLCYHYCSYQDGTGQGSSARSPPGTCRAQKGLREVCWLLLGSKIPDGPKGSLACTLTLGHRFLYFWQSLQPRQSCNPAWLGLIMKPSWASCPAKCICQT